MTAPSKNWSNIADTQIDADSPLDTTLLTAIRDDLVHIKEWLGDGYAAAKAHRHNDIDSAKINDADIIKINAVSWFDDFLDPTPIKWTTSGTVAVLNTANGVCRVTTTGGAYQGLFQLGCAFKLSAGITVTFEARVNRQGGATPYAGLTDTYSPTNGFYFEFTNGLNFIAVTQSGGVKTGTDTGIAATSGQWYVLKIVATSSAVLFYIDGVLKATHTTNIPTTNLGPCSLIYDAGAGYILDTDYVNCSSSGRM